MIRLSSKSVICFASYDFVNRDLRAVFTPLDMLTYPFCLLSKPNSPSFSLKRDSNFILPETLVSVQRYNYFLICIMII